MEWLGLSWMPLVSRQSEMSTAEFFLSRNWSSMTLWRVSVFFSVINLWHYEVLKAILIILRHGHLIKPFLRGPLLCLISLLTQRHWLVHLLEFSVQVYLAPFDVVLASFAPMQILERSVRVVCLHGLLGHDQVGPLLVIELTLVCNAL